MPTASEIVEPDVDRAIARADRRVQLHPQAGDGCTFHRFAGAVGKQVQPLLGGVPRAGQELAFSPVQFQSKAELMPALPRAVRQLVRAGS